MSDLFDEDLLSPEEEDSPCEGDLLRVKSNEAMESILLETSPIDDQAASSITDEVKSLSLEEKSTDISQYFLADEAKNDPFEVIATKEEEKEQVPDHAEKVENDDKVDNADMDLVENTDKVEIIDKVTPNKRASASGEEIVRIRYNSESNREEAVPVPFEESKGNGLKFTQSTKNLTKFFVDSPTEADPDAKEFFDTFAATDESSASISRSTSSLPPETPPIPSSMHNAPFSSLTTQTSLEAETTFSSIEASFQDADDPFSASLQMSDTERRHDAWIASEMTRQTLTAIASSQPPYIPEPSHLTMPGIIIEESLGDPVKELMFKFMGEAAAAKRQTLSADKVTQDKDGLTTLINHDCYRAAVELTGRLLTACGQGPGKQHTPTRHTPYSLELWFVRLSLLMKLRLYSPAETELHAFANLDNPDLYYEFYPDLYPGRRGSMVSFDMRVLHAEFPQYLGKTQESLDRLDYLHAIVIKMLSYLEAGFAEDGSILHMSDTSRQASRDLWQTREIRLLYSIVNCLLNIKDFGTALNVFEKLLKLDKDKNAELLSAIGRIYLQMGDIAMARNYFEKAEKKEAQNNSACFAALNKGFLALGNNQFSDAFAAFKKAVDIDPDNAVAINNMAVCALYQGKLKEALHVLESLVQSNPSKYLQEGVLFNLCTLYELESSRAMTKKQALLDLVSQHKGNGFNVACLKMA